MSEEKINYPIIIFHLKPSLNSSENIINAIAIELNNFKNLLDDNSFIDIQIKNNIIERSILMLESLKIKEIKNHE